jgi:biopolymer transport protein ExbD
MRNRFARIMVFAIVLASLALSTSGCDRLARMRQNQVQLDMAKVNNPIGMPDAGKEDAIVVSVTRTGNVFLGQNKTDLRELGNQVRDRLADKPSKTVYIRADARAQYRTVEDAIDATYTAGVDDVGLLTGNREVAPQESYFACAKAPGKPLGLDAMLPLSVLSTCVTKQTKDMRYSEAEP